MNNIYNPEKRDEKRLETPDLDIKLYRILSHILSVINVTISSNK